MLHKFKLFSLLSCLSFGLVYCAQDVDNTVPCELEQPKNKSNEIKKSTKPKNSKSLVTVPLAGVTVATLIWVQCHKRTTGGSGEQIKSQVGHNESKDKGVNGASGCNFLTLAKYMRDGDIKSVQNLLSSIEYRTYASSLFTNQSDFPTEFKFDVKKDTRIHLLHYATRCMDPRFIAFLVANGACVNGEYANPTGEIERANTILHKYTPLDCLGYVYSGSYMFCGDDSNLVSYKKTVILLALLGGFCGSRTIAKFSKNDSNVFKIFDDITEDLLTQNVDPFSDSDLKLLLSGNVVTPYIYSRFWTEKSKKFGGNAIHNLLTMNKEQMKQHNLTDDELLKKIILFVDNIKDFITTNFGTFYDDKIKWICDIVVKIYLNIKDENGHRPLFYAKNLSDIHTWLVNNHAVIDNEVVTFTDEEFKALN